MVGRRLEQHDSNQLELKLAYELEPAKPKQRYAIEAWFFVPRTLGLTKASYSKERFYEDTSAWVRLKTPVVALPALAEAEAAAAWFDPVTEGLEQIAAGVHTSTARSVNRLKLLGCIYRRALVDEASSVAERCIGFRDLEGDAREARAAELTRVLAGFQGQTQGALARIRLLRERCEAAATPARIKDAWLAVDEYVALVAQEALTRVVDALDAEGGSEHGSLASQRAQLAEDAVAAYRYRRGRGYTSFVRLDDANESLPYRRHVLKRIVSSVLYLGVREEAGGRMATNVIGMVAAGLAMLFAVLATIWASQHYEMASTAFVVLAVVSYVVKDRIKELGKHVLGRRVSRWLPDKKTEIREEGGARLGVCRESFAVVYDAPPDIKHLRYIDHTSSVASDGRPETVLRYTKNVTLRWDALGQRSDHIHGLNDIIRFNLQRLRVRMDAPRQNHRFVDPETKRVVDVSCARVYHVNLVLRFTVGTGAEQRQEIDRVRIVIDQRGIRRVEEIKTVQHSLVTAPAGVELRTA